MTRVTYASRACIALSLQALLHSNSIGSTRPLRPRYSIRATRYNVCKGVWDVESYVYIVLSVFLLSHMHGPKGTAPRRGGWRLYRPVVIVPYEPPWYVKFPALRRDKIIRTLIIYIKITHIYTHDTFPLILKIDPSLKSIQLVYPLF
jgi:hypothetical protein